MTKHNITPVHPGEILLEEFMIPMNISQYRLAKALHVGAMRINEIIHGERAITADTAIRLGLYFKMEAKFWLNLQSHYDLNQIISKHYKTIAHDVEPWNKAA